MDGCRLPLTIQRGSQCLYTDMLRLSRKSVRMIVIVNLKGSDRHRRLDQYAKGDRYVPVQEYGMILYTRTIAHISIKR